mmetsp:Transcript_14910/g.27636  ORF Transcript_14910/g.27636 Transcript_14910/m.27636 type:complete len:267 (+) Transcript_14910:435-1235(+)
MLMYPASMSPFWLEIRSTTRRTNISLVVKPVCSHRRQEIWSARSHSLRWAGCNQRCGNVFSPISGHVDSCPSTSISGAAPSTQSSFCGGLLTGVRFTSSSLIVACILGGTERTVSSMATLEPSCTGMCTHCITNPTIQDHGVASACTQWSTSSTTPVPLSHLYFSRCTRCISCTQSSTRILRQLAVMTEWSPRAETSIFCTMRNSSAITVALFPSTWTGFLARGLSGASTKRPESLQSMTGRRDKSMHLRAQMRRKCRCSSRQERS